MNSTFKYLKTNINYNIEHNKNNHTTWRRDELSLIKLHKQLIKTKADYGLIINISGKLSYNKIIEGTLNTSIRLVLVQVQ